MMTVTKVTLLVDIPDPWEAGKGRTKKVSIAQCGGLGIVDARAWADAMRHANPALRPSLEVTRTTVEVL